MIRVASKTFAGRGKQRPALLPPHLQRAVLLAKVVSKALVDFAEGANNQLRRTNDTDGPVPAVFDDVQGTHLGPWLVAGLKTPQY